jgi:hypothetical protein
MQRGRLRLIRVAAQKASHFRIVNNRSCQRVASTKAHDPVRIEKIAASKRGKPRPAHVVAILKAANERKSKLAALRRRKARKSQVTLEL